MKAKTERNKQILKWYFEDDFSLYQISDKVREVYKDQLRSTTVWEIIHRFAERYGYGENHA